MSKNIIRGLVLAGITSGLIGAGVATRVLQQPESKVLAQKPVEQIGQDLKDNQKILDRKLDVDAIVKRRNEIDRELAEIRAERKAILDRNKELSDVKKLNDNLNNISDTYSAGMSKINLESINRKTETYKAAIADINGQHQERSKIDLVNDNSQDAINYQKRRVQESLNKK
jgi:hypothetical protein